MNILHQEILKELQAHKGIGTSHSNSDSYLNSGHFYYSVSVPQKRKIAKEWSLNHKDISLSDFLLLLDSLYVGKSYEEKTIGSLLLGYLPKLRKQINPKKLVSWLGELKGWAEIDSLCQGNFTSEELLSNWPTWRPLLEKLSKDSNISKRRASLVFLTSPVTKTDDKRLSNLSFEIIDRLKKEKEILITKAISWLLRSLIKYHKSDAEKYLKENSNSLPKIAIRETQKKLLTGKK